MLPPESKKEFKARLKLRRHIEEPLLQLIGLYSLSSITSSGSRMFLAEQTEVPDSSESVPETMMLLEINYGKSWEIELIEEVTE
jgi:hypothetical protein